MSSALHYAKMTPDQFKSLFEANAKHWGALAAFGDRLRFVGSPTVAADDFCQSITGFRFRKLGKNWFDLEDIRRRSRCPWIDPAVQLAKRLQTTLAYGETLFESSHAEQLAREFFEIFQVGRVIRLTNWMGHYDPTGRATGWSGHTILDDYTFGQAFVGMDDTIIGLVLLFDED